MRFYSYHLQVRSNSFTHHYGRLFQQYVTDMYAKIDQNRLNYIKNNQNGIRQDLYANVRDTTSTVPAGSLGKKVVLPSSYQASPRNMQKRFYNAMALVREYGKPDLFITFTTNPQWR